MRLFVAVELPDRVSRALADIQSGIPGARWVSQENMRLTLKFLGDADGGQAEDLSYELARVDMPSFETHLDGAGQFSGRAGLKALWMGVAPPEPLIALQTRVERACRRAGFPTERRAYKPHITLARFNYPPDLESARRFLELYGRFRSESFRVSGFSLFSSELRPGGAIHRAEADYPFSDAGIGETPFYGDWNGEWDAEEPTKSVRLR